METKEGFYKRNEEGNWMYAPTFVESATCTLIAELKDTYTYPVDGWAWYDEEPK
jgi:hypothetical protein